ncbi:IS1 family transposase (plasmid) [Nostoc sp. C052]|uniref:IS1 family transposase n=1 Tax=Nostoc sp. C052 TaxID=2576902 RepID=UPI0015C35377|nr:IS1 family transposase [Nostoc sp. C052]QLE46550.1 IS1 family transposase [Nostoc sp. C052]
MFGGHYRRDVERRQQKEREHKKAEQQRAEQEKANEKRGLDWNPPLDITNCPICGSDRITPLKEESEATKRYRCNSCLRSVSSTTGTLAHKTHLPPETRQSLYQSYKKRESIRTAVSSTGVNKNTVCHWYEIFRKSEAQTGDDADDPEREETTYKTKNSYANHPMYQGQVDSDKTSELIRRGEINSDCYVDKRGNIRDGMNRIVDSI